MQTRVIGVQDRFFNIFTKYGRNRNHLFKEMKAKGINHIRERRLQNNSRVILGYENADSKTASYAFMVNPDLTLEQKTVETKYMMNGFGDQYVYITKIWADNKGEKVNQEYRTLKYRNNKIVGKTRSTLDKKLSTARAEGEGIGWMTAIMDGRVKLYKRESMVNSDYYKMAEYEDGRREYEKRIGDTEYYFST